MSMAFLQMAGVFSELELSMIRTRVRSGIANARAKGKQIGRKPVTKADLPSVFMKYYPSYANEVLVTYPLLSVSYIITHTNVLDKKWNRVVKA